MITNHGDKSQGPPWGHMVFLCTLRMAWAHSFICGLTLSKSGPLISRKMFSASGTKSEEGSCLGLVRTHRCKVFPPSASALEPGQSSMKRASVVPVLWGREPQLGPEDSQRLWEERDITWPAGSASPMGKRKVNWKLSKVSSVIWCPP